MFFILKITYTFASKVLNPQIMKSSILKWYLLVFLFASDFVMFAQPGDEEEEGPSQEGDDDPPAPINTKLIWLAIVGISFAFYLYNRKQQAKRA